MTGALILDARALSIAPCLSPDKVPRRHREPQSRSSCQRSSLLAPRNQIRGFLFEEQQESIIRNPKLNLDVYRH